MRLLEPVKSRLRHSPLLPLLRPRRFHAYCVGLPKTGTTSIGAMFEREYRAAHEPLPEHTRRRILAAHAGDVDEADLRRYLRWRDRELYLEMEASHAIAVVVDRLVHLFPDARFILTVREPRSWLRSLVDQQLNGRARWAAMPEPGWRSEFFPRLHELTCGRAAYRPQDLPLKELGLYPVDGYLDWWTDHNDRVLDAVPPERLLVLPTETLSTATPLLAAFLDIPVGTLETGRSHANRAPRRHDVLAALDPDFLDERVDRRCGETRERIEQLKGEAPRSTASNADPVADRPI